MGTIRFTKDVGEKVLAANEGFKRHTSYEARNKKEENWYTITDGKLQRRQAGKSSWADSSYDHTFICNLEDTQKFLRKHKEELNLDI